MTHTYKITGMTCQGCQAKVQSLLSKVKGVRNVAIDLSSGEAIIHMDEHVPTQDFQAALKDYPKYQLTENNFKAIQAQDALATGDTETKRWFQTYKPILLIFAYIVGVTTLIEITADGFQWMRWMQHFMAGFFLVFCFFKLLDLRAFADAYASYDIIAKRWKSWGYVYASIELGLGISYLLGFYPILTNAITLVVMSVSIVGVLQSVLQKKTIRCACLGAVFNLPMSTVTVIEDALMIVMSLSMLIMLIG